MSERVLIWLLATFLVTTFSIAEAQQATKIPLIGFQSAASPSAVSLRAEAFRQGLRDLGYVEGKNIAIEW